MFPEIGMLNISYMHLKNMIYDRIPRANQSFTRTIRVSAEVEVETIVYFVIGIWNTFPYSLLVHGITGSVKICRFKLFLKQCFDKERSSPLLFTIYMSKIVFFCRYFSTIRDRNLKGNSGK